MTEDGQRTEEAANNKEQLETAPDCDSELEAEDITAGGWVVDKSQYVADADEATSNREWDIVSNFSADIGGMSFQSIDAFEPAPHQHGSRTVKH
jgi:hypothetical protein